jgi:hypothetical protein
MRVQRRSEGKGTRLSRKVPDLHQMPIVKATLRNGYLVPADMKGCAVRTSCRLDFDDPVASIRFETGDVIGGTGTVLDRGPSHFVSKIIAAKSTKVVAAWPEAPHRSVSPFGGDCINAARPRRPTIGRITLQEIAAQRPNNNGTLARRDAGGRCGGKQKRRQAVAPTVLQRQSKRMRVRRPHDKERCKCASGSANKGRTLKERSGKECVLNKSRSFYTAPDHHPKGQD